MALGAGKLQVCRPVRTIMENEIPIFRPISCWILDKISQTCWCNFQFKTLSAQKLPNFAMESSYGKFGPGSAVPWLFAMGYEVFKRPDHGILHFCYPPPPPWNYSGPECTTASQPQSLAIFWVSGEHRKEFPQREANLATFHRKNASQLQPYRYFLGNRNPISQKESLRTVFGCLEKGWNRQGVRLQYLVAATTLKTCLEHPFTQPIANKLLAVLHSKQRK